MDKWNTLASNETLAKVKEALEKQQFNVIVVENGEEAQKTVLSMIPAGAEVQDNTSITLEQAGIQDAIRNSGTYKSLHKEGLELDREKDAKKLMELRSIADWVVGSAHAVTEGGQLIIASNSGSNLPTYAYGSNHVIFVIGTQKIVKNLDDGMKRIFEYTLPLETVRARKAYGLPETWDSYPSKVLVFNKEPMPGRTTIVLVKEVLGY